jgi:hypothetical protein
MKTFRNRIPDRPCGCLAATLLIALCGPLVAADLDLELIGSWPLSPRGPAQAVAVSGNYAYVATSGAGLQVIDISDLANPRRVDEHHASEAVSAVAVSGKYAYVIEQSWVDGTDRRLLQVIDISDPANPQRVGACVVDGDPYEVVVSGSFVYVADGWAGLQVIDISSPANPQRVGNNSGGQANGVAVSDDNAYVTGWWGEGTSRLRGLHVFDLSDPEKPQRIGGYDTSGIASGVTVSGDYAYVLETREMSRTYLQVIDIRNPADPQLVGTYDTSGYAYDVAVLDNHAYVTGYWGEGTNRQGMQVIDISSPENPQRVGEYEADWDFYGGVVVSGNHAYVAAGELQVIDISDSAKPQQVGAHDPRVYGGAWRCQVTTPTWPMAAMGCRSSTSPTPPTRSG